MPRPYNAMLFSTAVRCSDVRSCLHYFITDDILSSNSYVSKYASTPEDVSAMLKRVALYKCVI